MARDSFDPRGLLNTGELKEVDVNDGPCGLVTEGRNVPCAVLISLIATFEKITLKKIRLFLPGVFFTRGLSRPLLV